MATPPRPETLQELLDLVRESGYSSETDWTRGISDAGRLSIERLLGEREIGRTQKSHGLIRLSGDGVAGHSASASEVAEVISSFQRLATAVGASLAAGNTSLRGQISAGITYRTRLRLEASPAPGSLVLNLSPQAPPTDEASPGGAAPMFDEAEPLADQAMEVIVSILGDAGTLGPDPDVLPLLGRIEQLGPRSAATLRAFALALASGDFDSDIGWQVPMRPSMRVALSASDAKEIARLVESRNLDAEPVEIIGEMRTVSDLTAWVVDGDDGVRYQIDGQGIPVELGSLLHVHSRVKIQAEMTPTRHVGGAFRYSYTARSLEILA